MGIGPQAACVFHYPLVMPDSVLTPSTSATGITASVLLIAWPDIRQFFLKAKHFPAVNNLHMAVHPRGDGSTLVSSNLRAFERVKALELADWVV